MNDHEYRILHVDDDEDDRRSLAESLQKLNGHYQITGADGCDDLFNLLREDNSFDLIIMDINMPKVDGKECLRRIKADERYRNIPVIMFTVSHSEQDIDQVYEYGAHYYVVKPYFERNFSLTLQHLFDVDWKKNPPVPPKDSFVINFAFA